MPELEENDDQVQDYDPDKHDVFKCNPFVGTFLVADYKFNWEVYDEEALRYDEQTSEPHED